MKKRIWILAVVALLLLFPDLGTVIAATITPVLNRAASQPLLLGFGLGLAAMPHLRRTATVRPQHSHQPAGSAR